MVKWLRSIEMFLVEDFRAIRGGGGGREDITH